MRITVLTLAATGFLLAGPVHAEINYIPLEEAEEVRLCLHYKRELARTLDELRDATVAGGSKVGSSAEVNHIRTKLRFEKKHYTRKITEECDGEDIDLPALEEAARKR